MTKNTRTVPVAVASAASTCMVIPVFPKPRTKSLIVTDSPTPRESMVPDLVFPIKISFPSRFIVQSRSDRFIDPVFEMVAETPSPPFIMIVTVGTSFWMVKEQVFSVSVFPTVSAE